MLLPVTPRLAAAEVGFLSRSVLFSPHSCELWSCTGVRSSLHPRYKVTTLKLRYYYYSFCAFCSKDVWTADKCFKLRAVEDAVISFPLHVINAALLFINVHDPKRSSDLSSQCYKASNTIWWIVKAVRNIFAKMGKMTYTNNYHLVPVGFTRVWCISVCYCHGLAALIRVVLTGKRSKPIQSLSAVEE